MALKEIKLRPNTCEHDVETKAKSARRFLERGDQVKITVRFRGREIVHQEIGRKRAFELAKLVGDVSTIRGEFTILGKMMTITLDPRKRGTNRPGP